MELTGEFIAALAVDEQRLVKKIAEALTVGEAQVSVL
jgi:hypothetical protein